MFDDQYIVTSFCEIACDWSSSNWTKLECVDYEPEDDLWSSPICANGFLIYMFPTITIRAYDVTGFASCGSLKEVF
jgi:hypothetical protein